MGKGSLIGKVVGIEKITGEFQLEKEIIRHRIRSEVGDLAIELLGVARGMAPHKTGALRGSMRWSGAATDKGVYAQVGTDEPLGRWMEFGWTPNPRRGTKAKYGKDGRVSVQGWTKGGRKYRKGGSSEWTRNPRSKGDWADYIAIRGGRTVYSHPFLSPAFDSMRNTIRERLRAAVEDPA